MAPASAITGRDSKSLEAARQSLGSLVLAFGAHVGAGDPGWPPALVTWVLLIVSWLTANRVRAVKSAYAPGSAAAVGT